MAVTISEATWNELLDEAQASVDRWNARCTGCYAKYSHELKVTDCGASVLAEAIQRDADSGSRPKDQPPRLAQDRRRRDEGVGQGRPTQSGRPQGLHHHRPARRRQDLGEGGHQVA